MVVAGNDGAPGHASRVVALALDMLEATAEVQAAHPDIKVQVRVGIHSGETGVLGDESMVVCCAGTMMTPCSPRTNKGLLTASSLLQLFST